MNSRRRRRAPTPTAPNVWCNWAASSAAGSAIRWPHQTLKALLVGGHRVCGAVRGLWPRGAGQMGSGAGGGVFEYRKHKHLLSSKALAELTPRQHSVTGFPPKSSHRHKNRPSCHRIRPKVAATGARQKSCLTDRWQCDSCLCI